MLCSLFSFVLPFSNNLSKTNWENTFITGPYDAILKKYSRQKNNIFASLMLLWIFSRRLILQLLLCPLELLFIYFNNP